MTVLLGASIGASIALGVLLGYLNVHRKSLGLFHWSPRLVACWLLPIIDATVTIYLIAGGWFGLSKSNMGIQMTLFSVWTSIGLSATVFVIRKMFVQKWREEFQHQKMLS